MRLMPVVLAMSLLSPAALAQERKAAEQVTLQPMQAPSQPHIISANELRNTPSLRPVIAAVTKSGLPRVSTSVSLIWDSTGKVTRLTLDKPTGAKALDAAILRWAALLEFNTQQAGEGTLPIEMMN